MIREYLSLFSGNEIVIALVFFNWLILGGIGALLARKIMSIIPDTVTAGAWISLILCGIGVIQILFARYFFQSVFIQGASSGFYPVFGFTFLISSPYCILLGFSLAFFLSLAQNKGQRKISSTRIYLTDNIGDTLGGVLFSFFLVWFMSPVQAVFLAGVPLVLMSIALIINLNQKYPVKNGIIIFSILVSMVGCLFYEPSTLHLGDSEPVFYKETPYGRVAVYQSDEDYVFYLNSVPLFDTNNTIKAEKQIHLPMSQLAHPAGNILFVSAAAGAFTQINKYRFQELDYVEIDAQVIKAMFDFPFFEKTGKLNIIADDAARYLLQTQKKYDVIIMDIPGPDTFQANRFYTVEFFTLLKKHLSHDGVIGFSVQGFDNYPARGVLKTLSILYKTVTACFDHVLVMPGPDTFFLAKNTPINPDITGRLQQMKIDTDYLQDYFDQDYPEDKIRWFSQKLQSSASINSDYSPVLVRTAFDQWFEKHDTSPLPLMLVLGAGFLYYLFRMADMETTLFFTGFTAMGFEAMVLFVFQILFGYIYIKAGIIITLFLGGLIPGAFMGEKFSGSRPRRIVCILDGLIIIFIMLFAVLSVVFKPNLGPWFFFLAAFIMAMFCGFQFAAVIQVQKDTAERVTGFFAADIMGGALGVICFSLILLPYLGMPAAGIALATLKLAGVMRARPWKP